MWRLLIILLLFFACGKKQTNTTRLLKTDNLPTQVLEIDITKDTVVTTANGAILTIPKGSIIAPTNKVQLDLKEAYSMQQILLGGLSTTSNGIPLSSDGMWYLSPKDTNNVKIATKLSIKVPTKKVQDSMQVYKGEMKDGKLNWAEPRVFKVKSVASTNPNGKALFESNCASCHAVNKDATGPALANIGERRNRHYLYTFINNWEDAIHSGDCQAIKTINYAPWTMNKFNFKKNEIDAIIDYVSSVSDTSFLYEKYIKRQQDSCENYNKIKGEIYKLEKEKNKIAAVKKDFFEESKNPIPNPIPAPTTNEKQ